MHKRDRLQAIFAGDNVDRPAVSLWRHWPGDDQDAAELARAQTVFQNLYDFDFIKVSPSSSFSVEDWGVVSAYQGNNEGSRSYVQHVIRTPADWGELSVLDPRQGALGRQLRCLELLYDEYGDQVPFIQTVFNPLSVAKYLAGDELMHVHLRRYPDALQAGLETITETVSRFVREVINTGAAGIFLAVQHAQLGSLSESEYQDFGQPSDLAVLEATEGAWFNLLHLHGEQVMFDLVAQYPVQVINWHDRETWPTLKEGKARFQGAVCGGLRQWDTLMDGTPNQVQAEAVDAMCQTEGRRFILGTGCVTPITSPTRNLCAARQAVEAWPS
jgi:uroporphyrinogen decarboxylase